MIIISQNITNYDISVPQNAVFRINLAWVNNLNDLTAILEKHKERKIFLDLPIKRTKPPNNRYTLDDIIDIVKVHNNIEYFAISNVESKNNLVEYIEKLPRSITLVPKIESHLGVENIEEISNLLGKEKVIMLDHDDLYSSMIKSNDNPKNFSTYVQNLINFCNSNNITLLRTVGVMFADTEKRVSDYVN